MSPKKKPGDKPANGSKGWDGTKKKPANASTGSGKRHSPRASGLPNDEIGSGGLGLPNDPMGSGGSGETEEEKKAKMDAKLLHMAKKKSLEMPCAECKKKMNVALMFPSERSQHRQWEPAGPNGEASEWHKKRSGHRLNEDTPDDKRDTNVQGYWRIFKICADCEVDLRRAEGTPVRDKYEVLEEVINKFKSTKNEMTNGRRVKCYKDALEEVGELEAERGQKIPKKERRQLVSEKAKEKFNNFIDAVTQDGTMFDLITTAGKDIENYAKLCKDLESVENQIEAEKDGERKKLLIDKFEELNEQIQIEMVPDSYAMSDNQWEMLDALDNDDRITDTFRRFYVCRRQRWSQENGKWKSCTCGCYFPSSFWRRDANKKYKCQVDWEKALKYYPDTVTKAMAPKWGTDVSKWPLLGCGENFIPFAKGMSTVIEYKCNKTKKIQTFMSDIFPDKLQHVLAKHKVAWMKAAEFTSREELLRAVSVVFPRANIVEGIPFLSRFPVDEHIADGGLMVSQKAWCKYCMLVARGSKDDLWEVLDCAEKEYAKLEIEETAAGAARALLGDA